MTVAGTVTVERYPEVKHNKDGPLAADYHIHVSRGDGDPTEGAVLEVVLHVGY